jgi:hypothetical protein
LHNSREIVERQILDLDTRIDAAKAFASLNNAHEDPLGYADLKRKRRIRGMWHQVIAQEIGSGRKLRRPRRIIAASATSFALPSGRWIRRYSGKSWTRRGRGSPRTGTAMSDDAFISATLMLILLLGFMLGRASKSGD